MVAIPRTTNTSAHILQSQTKFRHGRFSGARPPVMTILCTRGGPSLSDEAFRVAPLESVLVASRNAASVAQGATCCRRSAARHIVIRAVAAAACSCAVCLGELV